MWQGKYTRGLSLLLATTVMISVQAPGHAREGAGGEELFLEEIITTAQRRTERAKDVPISIATVGGESLAAFGSSGEDIRYLSSRIPSLQIESSLGRTFPRFYIRGLGNSDFDANASQPVSFVYDDVVLENPHVKGFPLFDIERVEVLRGPQGTLFGRNTPAGIVKVDSRRPTQDFEAYFNAGYGRFNATNVEGAISGPVSDVLAVRLSFLHQRQDDWVDNVAPTAQEESLEAYDDLAGRLQFLYTPNEDLSLLIKANARRLDGTARLFRANIFKPGTNDFVDDFEIDEVAMDGQNFQEVTNWGLTGTLTYDFEGVTLTSITAYRSATFKSRGDIDGGYGAAFNPPFGPGFIPFPAESRDDIPDLDQYTQELRLASNNSENFGYQVGFFYFDEKLSVESFNYNTFTGVNDIIVRQRFKNKAWGVFGSANYNVTDSFKVIAGLRYNDDSRDFFADREIGFLGAATFVAEADDSLLTWDASGVYEVDEDTNLYARVAKGYRAPSIQGRVLFSNDVSTAESEKVLSFEAGVKATLADGRARLNLSGFYYRAKDQQLTAAGGALNINRLVNADKSIGYGFEVEGEARLSSNLHVTAGASYNFTEIQDENLGIVPCGGGCTVLDPVLNPGTVSIDGNSLPQAPRWTLNATARYGVPVANGGEVFFFTDWSYRSSTNFFLYEAAEFTGEPLLLGGLRIGYAAADDQYEIAAYIRNITNDIVAISGIDFNNLTGMVNEPRVWGVQGNFRF